MFRKAYGPLTLTLLLVTVGCAWLFAIQLRAEEHTIARQLESIGRLKSEEIARWRSHFLRETAMIAKRTIVVDFLRAFQTQPDTPPTPLLLQALEGYKLVAELDDIILIGTTGNVLARTAGASTLDDAQVQATITETLNEGRPTISGIYGVGPDLAPKLCAASPLHYADGTLAGACLIVVDVGASLYPLLEGWPVPSETAEFYLVQREADAVLFLCPLRHLDGAPLRHRVPVSETNMTCVRAVLGETGLMEGIDYRSVPVIAVARLIPDSGWHLIAQIDQREAFSVWRKEMAMIVALMALLLFLPLLSGLLLWKERQRAVATSLAEAGALAERMNRVYRMLSRTNELIVCAKSRQELLDGVTRIAVEEGEFLFAWIGHPLEDGRVVPLARYGSDHGYIDATAITLDPANPRSAGPTAQVLRSGKTMVTNNFLSAPETAPWHAEAERAGLGASAVFALHYHGAVFGSLNLYAAQDRYFGTDEVSTLERMTTDISHALDNLDSNAENARLLAALKRAMQAVEASPTLLFRWRPEEGCPVEYVSANIRRWGYSPEQFLSGEMAYTAIIHPEDLPRCAAAHARLLAQELQEVPVTYRIRTAAGEIRTVEDVTSLDRDASGAVQGLSGVVTDVTERMEASEGLLKSEQRLRMALNSSQQGLYDVNIQTGERLVSGEYALMLGYDPDGFHESNASWIERLHPDDRETTLEALQGYLEGRREEYRVVYRLRHRDGSWRWTLSLGKVVEHDHEGNPLRMLGTHTDITEMKQTEELLRLQSASLEAAANGIVITGVDGHVVWANPAFVRLTGYSLEESRGQNPSKLVQSGEHTTEFYESMWKTILAGNVWQGELINRRKDGSLYDEAMSITPIRDAAGAITHFVAVKQDITERRQFVRTLQESESRFRGLIEDLDVGVLLQDAKDQILLTNRAARELLGLSSDTTGTLSSEDARWQLIRQDGSPLPLDEVPSIIAARTRVPVRGAVIGSTNLATGTRVWLSVSASPRLDSQGDLNNVLVTAVNITAERQAEEAFVRSKEKLDQAVSAGHIALWEWDILKDTCTYSDEWCQQLGYARGEVKGDPADWWNRVHPEDIPQIKAMRDHLNAMTGNSLTHEYRMLHKDGKYRWILGSVSITRDEAGKPIQLSGANIDITVQKELEGKFQQAQKMESIGRLAGGVAHDFNNILGVILGYTEMTIDELPEDSALRQDLIQVKNAALRAADLTNQLLAFSRRQVLRPELLDLNYVIKQAEKMLGRMVGEDVQIATHYEEDLGRVLADPGQISQVMLNLAVNARDAMPKGGSLTIMTENTAIQHHRQMKHGVLSPGAYVRISVSDTGTGMDDHTLSHLFEPFFTTKDQGKGTGLGLATVYGIVEQSGGTIAVESALGQGSTFQVYLPRVDSLLPEPDEESVGPVWRGDETILLVEDEVAIRELTRRALAALGYTVYCAASGAEALALMKDQAPAIDLLLTDVIMPGMSGAALAQTMRERYPALPVLYMSGYTDDAIAHHGVLQQGAHLINKPFKRSELARVIREIMERSQQLL